MADPLAALAEREVPERTNYFDPDAARTIIAKYGNTRAERESSGAFADAAARYQAGQSQALRLREDAARAARDKVMQGREDREYAARQEALAQQGEFLSSLNDLNPEDPEYDVKVTEFMGGLPPELHEEPAVKSILAYKNRVADSIRTEKEMQTRRNETFQDRKELLKMRYENDNRLAALSPQERQSFVDPATGEFDSVGAAQLAYQKTRGDKKEDSKEIIAERAKASAQKAEELDRRKSVAEIGVADQEAFPSQIETFRTQYPKFNPSAAKPEEMVAFEKAKAYERKKLESEMASALARDNPDEYVNLVPNASEAAKKKRRDLWELAHEMRGNATPETPDSATPSATPEQFQKTKSIGGVTYGFDGKGWRPVGG